MATSKTLTPTNETISIPAMTDQPDASVFSNCVDKEADAINALNSQLTSVSSGSLHDIVKTGVYFLTSAVTDKPVMESGYGGTYQVAVGGNAQNPVIAGTFISMYDNSVWSIKCLNGTWTYTNISGTTYGTLDGQEITWERTGNVVAIYFNGKTVTTASTWTSLLTMPDSFPRPRYTVHLKSITDQDIRLSGNNLMYRGTGGGIFGVMVFIAH